MRVRLFPGEGPQGIRTPGSRRATFVDAIKMGFFDATKPPFSEPTSAGMAHRWLDGVFYQDDVYRALTDPNPANGYVPRSVSAANCDNVTETEPTKITNGATLFAHPVRLGAASELKHLCENNDRRRAYEALDYIVHEGLADALALAILDHPTPSVTVDTVPYVPVSLTTMPDYTLTLTGGGSLDLLEAFVAVDAELSALYPTQRGVIYMSPAAAAWVQMSGGYTFDEQQGVWLSPLGNLVAVSDAFEFAPGPTGDPLEAPSPGHEWIWGSSLPMWTVTALQDPKTSGTSDDRAPSDADVWHPLDSVATNTAYRALEYWAIFMLRPRVVAARGCYPCGGCPEDLDEGLFREEPLVEEPLVEELLAEEPPAGEPPVEGAK